MANPFEKGIDNLKDLPRGVWLTAAGLGIGIGVIILWRNRNKPPANPTATDAGMSNADQMTSQASPVGYGSWGGGVDSGALGGGNTVNGSTDPFADSLNNVGGIIGLIGSLQDLFGGQQPDSTAATGGVASPPPATTGGGSGSASPTNPQNAPVVTGQVTQPSSVSCPPGYPHPGPNPGSCYKIVCLKANDGHGHGRGKWHVYRDGSWHQVTSGAC